MFEAAIDAPANAVQAPRRCRKRTLTQINSRTILGKRIVELTALFTNALTGPGVELSPMRRMKIDEAAQLQALAEKARGAYLRDGEGDLAELVAAERHAAAAVKRLGLPAERGAAKPSGGPAAPAHDLTQLSGNQLDRLYSLLAESSATKSGGAP